MIKKVSLAFLFLCIAVLIFGVLQVFIFEKYLESIVYFYFGTSSLLMFCFFQLIKDLRQPLKSILLLFLSLFYIYIILGWIFPDLLKMFGQNVLILFVGYCWVLLNHKVFVNQPFRWFYQIFPLIGCVSLFIGLNIPTASLQFYYISIFLFSLQTIYSVFHLVKS